MSLGLHREKVRLVQHDPLWATIYQDEEANLRKMLKDQNIVDIQHIGSTSIPGIVAKPLMGILLVVKNLETARQWRGLLEKNGYHHQADEPDHILLAKGPEHRRIVHLHIAEKNSEYANIALIFRDYLRANPKIAQDYGRLKTELAEKHAGNREKYTQSKNAYIRKVIKTAQSYNKRGQL